MSIIFFYIYSSNLDLVIDLIFELVRDYEFYDAARCRENVTISK